MFSWNVSKFSHKLVLTVSRRSNFIGWKWLNMLFLTDYRWAHAWMEWLNWVCISWAERERGTERRCPKTEKWYWKYLQVVEISGAVRNTLHMCILGSLSHSKINKKGLMYWWRWTICFILCGTLITYQWLSTAGQVRGFLDFRRVVNKEYVSLLTLRLSGSHEFIFFKSDHY